jgi:hypothetical protein
MTPEEQRCFERIVDGYYIWRQDTSDQGIGAMMALSSLLVGLGWAAAARKRLAELVKENDDH